FPLVPELRAVLERQLATTLEFEQRTGQIVPWLFHREGRPIKSFRRAWLAACKQAGLARVVTRGEQKIGYPLRIPHDFRRTAVRNLERADVPRSTAMAMVGMRTESIYRRYAIVDEAMLREGGDKLAAFGETQQAARGVPFLEASPRRRYSQRPSQSVMLPTAGRAQVLEKTGGQGRD